MFDITLQERIFPRTPSLVSSDLPIASFPTSTYSAQLYSVSVVFHYN